MNLERFETAGEINEYCILGHLPFSLYLEFVKGLDGTLDEVNSKAFRRVETGLERPGSVEAEILGRAFGSEVIEALRSHFHISVSS
jgi:hypothetical protein